MIAYACAMRFSRPLVGAVATAAALLAPALTTTAPAAVSPPPKALPALDLRVSWPVSGAESEVRAGSRLTVSLRRTSGRRAGARTRAAARVSLVRLDLSGRAVRTVASKRLGRAVGRVVVTLPTAQGVSYELRLKVAAKRFASRLVVAAPPVVTPPVVTPPVWTPPLPKPPVCAAGTAAIERIYPSDAIVLNRADLTLRNAGPGCLSHTYGFSIERQGDDGTWTKVPADLAFPDVIRLLQPGETVSYDWTPPADAVPGDHRLVPSRFMTRDGAWLDPPTREFVILPR